MAARRERPDLILASGSRTRREILQAAGVSFTVVPADIDEAALTSAMRARETPASPSDIAGALARAKAEAVSRDNRRSLVIGADQVLAHGERLFDKARSLDEARGTLAALCGVTHRLSSAVVLAQGGNVVWTHAAGADMTMRAFSDAAVEDYLARAGDAVLDSVGAYQIEGPGIQLFERIDGDFFTILGLPLLPLLAELRTRGVLTS